MPMRAGASSIGPRRLHKEVQKLRALEASHGTPAFLSALALTYDLGLIHAMFPDLIPGPLLFGR